MSRKAQGLSLNIIIIAAISLLVLVILAIIFIGRMGTTTKGIDACKGICVEDNDACYAKGQYFKPTNELCENEDTPVCCIGV